MTVAKPDKVTVADQSGQGLSGDESGKAFMAGKAPDYGAVLLLDEGLVVGAVGA